MTGTSAFESIVPSIVATSRLSVRRRAIVGRTRATFKRMSTHDSPNAADLPRSPERLRRRGVSTRCAHSARRRFERARGHSRTPPGTRRRDRDPQDRAGRLCPRTGRDRTQDPLRFLQLDGPKASLRTGPATPRRVPAAARDPRRRPGRDLDVPEPSSDPGRPPRPRDDRTGSCPDDGGQGTDIAPLEHPLEAPGQGSRGLRFATQAESHVARTAAAVCRRRTSEHRRDPRPQPPRAIRIRPRRVLGNGRGPEEGAEDRGHQGRRDRAAIELALRGRSETLRCRNVRRRELTVNVWSISYSMSYTTADLDRRLKLVPEKDRAAVRSYVMTKAAPAREIRAWCHRGPQSLSAHAARHAI